MSQEQKRSPQTKKESFSIPATEEVVQSASARGEAPIGRVTASALNK